MQGSSDLFFFLFLPPSLPPGGKLSSLGPFRFLLKPDNRSRGPRGWMGPVGKRRGGDSRATWAALGESGRRRDGRGAGAAQAGGTPAVASVASCKEKCRCTVSTSATLVPPPPRPPRPCVAAVPPRGGESQDWSKSCSFKLSRNCSVPLCLKGGGSPPPDCS